MGRERERECVCVRVEWMRRDEYKGEHRRGGKQ